MKKRIKVLLTFDYELPLGGADDYHRGLFDPADSLIRKATELQVPIVLFADICSAVRFKEWDYQGYYVPFKNQVHAALAGGHDVQLHIHPHWMTSRFTVGGSFTPSMDFSLSNFKHDKHGYTIESIIELAYHELFKLCTESDPDYQCVAFRAGGYDVEPESKRILATLGKLGVKIDSSVIKEFYLDYSFSKVDYTNAPQPSHWFISAQGPLLKQESSGLLELPISSKPTSVLDIVARRGRKLLNRKEYQARIYKNSGKGFLVAQGRQSIKGKIKKMINPAVLSLDKEHIGCSDLMAIVDYNLSHYSKETDDLILTAIGHPKSMGHYHISLMEEFVQKMREKFRGEIDFVTYQDIRKNLPA